MTASSKLFWGVVFLLHPFILKLTGTLSVTAAKKYQIFTRILSTGSLMRLGKDSFFYMSVISGTILLQEQFRKLPLIESFIFFYFIAIGFLTTQDFLKPATFYQYLFFLAGILMFNLMYTKTNDEFGTFVLEVLFYAAIIHSVWIFLEYFGVNVYGHLASLIGGKRIGSGSSLVGVLNNTNVSSAYLAFCLPAFFTKKKLLFLPVVFAAICLLDSLMGVVTATSIVVFYFVNLKYGHIKANYLYVIGLIAMIAAPFIGLGGIDSYRFDIWKQAIAMSGDITLFGHGVGWFSDTFHLLSSGLPFLVRYEHNEFLAAYFAFGIVGILLSGYLFSGALDNKNAIMGAGLFGVFVNCYGNFALHFSPLALIAIFYFSECLKSSKRVHYV